MSIGEVFTVEISGISDISTDEIKAHFQKKKYGRGDVTITNFKDGKAVIIIEGITLESEIKNTVYRNACIDHIRRRLACFAIWRHSL